jgi:hypothetical protein
VQAAAAAAHLQKKPIAHRRHAEADPALVPAVVHVDDAAVEAVAAVIVGAVLDLLR